MRILFITQWFDPEPAFKGLLFARQLVEMGHDVEVLTGFPNYPGGKLYGEYRVRPLQREVMDGVRVVRVPLYPSHDRSALKRVANYASFALSAAVIGTTVVRSPDVAYVYHPPGSIGLPALTLRHLRHTPFVYDVQDLWPDTLRSTGMVRNSTLLWLVDQWTSFIYRQAAKITVLSPGFKEAIVARGISAEKVEVVYNWCDESHLKVTPRDEELARQLGMSGRFNIVFAGTMGKAQALDSVLNAAACLVDSHPHIQFVLVGGGIEVDKLKQLAESMNLRNVLFLAKRPPSEISAILALADVLLVHLKDDPLFSITIPSKTQAYMAVGKPMLMAVRGDAADLVQRARAGLTCMPGRSESLVEAVMRLYAMPHEDLKLLGRNGQRFYARELSLKTGAQRFAAIFESVRRR